VSALVLVVANIPAGTATVTFAPAPRIVCAGSAAYTLVPLRLVNTARPEAPTQLAVVAPPFLLATGTGEGTATHLGRFTATYEAAADLATPTATGTYRFTAANGDRLVATFVGTAVALKPGLERFTEVLTIVSGTGRFAAAAGTITLVRLVSIDYAAGTSTSTGSMEGAITLK